MARLNSWVAWFMQLMACMAISYLFFGVVESPAHRLATRVGRLLRRE